MFTRNPARSSAFVAELEGFEPRPIRLVTADGLRLAGWEFHREGAPATFIVVHGWGGAKEVMDDQIVFLCREGFDVVAIDLRNHGESEGIVTSVGYHEVKDVEAAIRHVRATPHLSQRIVLWGQSMGAASCIRAAERDPSIAALIAESSYVSLREIVRHYARLFFGRIPALLTPVLLWLARRKAKMDIDELDLLRSVARIRDIPVLFVAGEEDPRMPPETARRLLAACASGRKEIFIAPYGNHARLFAHSRAVYEEAVRSFIRELL